MRIVLSNIGTYGDTNPLIALALELKRRGHTPVMAVPEVYRAKIAPLGLEFHAVRPNIDPTNNVLAIIDCTWIRFRTTVFEARAFAQGLVFHHAVPPPAPPKANPRITAPKWSIQDYDVHVGGKKLGSHRIMALARGSTLPVDKILARAAAEAARHFGVAQRRVVTQPTRRSARRSGPAALPRFF